MPFLWARLAAISTVLVPSLVLLAAFLVLGALLFFLFWWLLESSGVFLPVALIIVVLLGIAGLAVLLGSLNLVFQYGGYLIKAGRIAVITHIVRQGDLTEDQVKYGKEAIGIFFKNWKALLKTAAASS